MSKLEKSKVDKVGDQRGSHRGRRNEVVGRVISDKMDKTISVQIYRLVKHPRYKKYVGRSSVFKAHDEHNNASVGDKVSIVESRPLSKTKRWKLSGVLESTGKSPLGVDNEKDLGGSLLDSTEPLRREGEAEPTVKEVL